MDNQSNQSLLIKFNHFLEGLSGISSSDKERWQMLAKKMSRLQLKILIDVLNENPKFFDFLNQNLKTKLDILKKGDVEGWKKILSQEKKQIEEITKTS